ncbi:HI_0552 family protein [Rodentibacter caecimuris]|uniref:Glucose-6-phosphate 1-dehydrogenase n=1 Tax=Rodentibacter caecimuris TaxID=1796644 RepID=A0ABX3KWL3_9PAST|nr:hypothetical protein BKG89_07475 [Rodentibacter heylii]
MLNADSCELFVQPFFQFSQLKKYCPERIPQLKASYKQHWERWKTLILQVSQELGTPFAKPHIESWTNGWQVRAHFFAYFKYEFHLNSAAIFSIILNRRRLSISLDWHCYRADRSRINIQQYNQWIQRLDFIRYRDFDIWRRDESEYADFYQVKQLNTVDLLLRSDEDFWCIGKNVEKTQLASMNSLKFISDTIRDLQPLYESCHC